MMRSSIADERTEGFTNDSGEWSSDRMACCDLRTCETFDGEVAVGAALPIAGSVHGDDADALLRQYCRTQQRALKPAAGWPECSTASTEVRPGVADQHACLRLETHGQTVLTRMVRG